MKNVLIKAVKLCKTYNTGNDSFHAIRNLDLDIYEGDFTIIMGSSGSGKSTLLYLLSGLDQLSVGEVYFKGQRIDQFDEIKMADFRARKIGYVYQGIHLVPDLTLFENIAFPGYVAGRKKKEVDTRVWELLRNAAIENEAKRLPSQVSGGQQQRAAITRALINNPEVLFADEPTGSLNYEMGESILDIFTQMNSKGQSVVMVTHDIKAASRADRIILIKDGKVDGILELDKYQPSDKKSRENMIFSYISRKE